MNHQEAYILKLRLEQYLDTVKKLIQQMDALEANVVLTNDQKVEELNKIHEQLSKVTLEIDSIKNEIKLLSVRHLN